MPNRLTLCLAFCLSATVVLLGATLFVPHRTPPPASSIVNPVIAGATGDPLLYTYADLVQRLGRPAAMTVEPVAGTPDAVRTLVYDDVTFSFYEAAQPPKSILYRLVLTGAGYTAPEGVRVGLSPQQVLDAVGPPTLRSARRYVYAAGEARPADLVVTFDHVRVQRVEWVVFFE